jgi:F-type H+-transporting ATPase subunit gamma
VANLRDIRRRIVSVQSTQKITSAMKMVSAAKLRRASDAIAAARPYAQRMRETLQEVASGAAELTHPLFEDRADKKAVEIVVVTSDRGLAGAFNSSVIKKTEELFKNLQKQFGQVHLTIVGKKAADFYKRRRPANVSLARPVGPHVNYLEAQQIAARLMQRFAAGEVDEVILVYSEFVTTMTQRPKQVELLPVRPTPVAQGSETEAEPSFEIEPSASKLLAALVPKAVEVEIFRALLENQAGEHAARMTAMESATKNTKELIDKLRLQFNRARQAAITRELVEIVTGAQALE